MKIELDCGTLLAVFLIIIGGILFIYLPHFGGREKKNKLRGIEHFPASLRFHEGIRRQPKALIPKIIKHMNQEKTLLKSLPDDYMYLYDYEKNFDEKKIYGDFKNRLEAYKHYLQRHKNDFHDLNNLDINNLTKLLNDQVIKDNDIPNNFSYQEEFKALESYK